YDSSNCDVSRSCFESYDPNIYVNYNAIEFNPTLRDEGFSMADRPAIIPITEEMVIIERIMKWDWKRDYVEGERNNFIFDLAGVFCEYGISQTSAEGYISNKVVNDDIGQTELKNAIKSAYKKRQFNSRYFEDYAKLDRIKSDLNKGKKYVIENHGIDEKTFYEIKENIEHEDFWFYDEDSKGNTKIKIDPLRYKLFLENSGFKKYYPNNNQSVKSNWVYIESNKVVETSVEKMKDYVLDYLLQNRKNDVWSYCAGYQNLFSENYLTILGSIELMLLKDKKDTSYIAFNNGILEIKKDSA